MSDDTRIMVLTAECEGLRAEMGRLRAEDSVMRPRISELEHRNTILAARLHAYEIATGVVVRP